MVLDNLALVALVELGSFPPLVAKLGSAEVAIVLMFVLNESWTFGQVDKRGGLHVLGRLLKSNLVRVGGVAVAVVTLYLLHTYLGMWYVAANVFGIGAGFLVNYVFENVLTWQVHRKV